MTSLYSIRAADDLMHFKAVEVTRFEIHSWILKYSIPLIILFVAFRFEIEDLIILFLSHIVLYWLPWIPHLCFDT